MIYINRLKEVLFKNYKIILLLSIVIIIILRAPIILTEPRLWAEEGNIYLEHALHSNWLDGIFFSPKRTAGYFNMACNVPTTIAAHMPIELAPTVTTYFSLLFFLVLFVKIIFNENVFFNTPANKIILCLIILFFPQASATAETWLNTANLQVYCGCISLVILLSENSYPSTSRLWLNAFLLLFCCMSGPYSLFLAPAFIYRLWRQRDISSLIYSITIIITAIIQVSLYLYLKYYDLLSAKKSVGASITKSFIGMFKYHVIQPILGMDMSIDFLKIIGYSSVNKLNVLSDYWITTGILSFMFILIVLLVTWKNQSHHILLILSFIFVSFFSAFFSINNVPHARYSLFPSVILGFLLLSKSNDLKIGDFNLYSMISLTILIIGLTVGVWEFNSFKRHVYFGSLQPVPSWRSQIAEWKDGNLGSITIWPYPRWKFLLSDREKTKELRERINNIASFDLNYSTHNSPRKKIKLGGYVKKFSLRVKFETEQFEEGDALSLRIVTADSSSNIINKILAENNNSSKSKIININMKSGFEKPSVLEFLIKSESKNAKAIITDIKYMSPHASF